MYNIYCQGHQSGLKSVPLQGLEASWKDILGSRNFEENFHCIASRRDKNNHCHAHGGTGQFGALVYCTIFFSFLAYQGISLEYFSNTGLVHTFHQLYTFILLLDFTKVSLAWSGKFWQPLGTSQYKNKVSLKQVLMKLVRCVACSKFKTLTKLLREGTTLYILACC